MDFNLASIPTSRQSGSVSLLSFHFHPSSRNGWIGDDVSVSVTCVGSESHKYTNRAFPLYVSSCALAANSLERIQPNKMNICTGARRCAACQWKWVPMKCWMQIGGERKHSHHMHSQPILDNKTSVTNRANVWLNERMNLLVHRQIVEFMECCTNRRW